MVRTPHIDGIAEFYRMVGNDLEIEATVDGVTSHVIGSRNLDLALLADGDGDGAVELVAPAQDLRSLAGIGRTDDGAAIEWVIDLGGAITTNVTAATHDGALWFAVGIDDRVRMWPGA